MEVTGINYRKHGKLLKYIYYEHFICKIIKHWYTCNINLNSTKWLIFCIFTYSISEKHFCDFFYCSIDRYILKLETFFVCLFVCLRYRLNNPDLHQSNYFIPLLPNRWDYSYLASLLTKAIISITKEISYSCIIQIESLHCFCRESKSAF